MQRQRETERESRRVNPHQSPPPFSSIRPSLCWLFLKKWPSSRCLAPKTEKNPLSPPAPVVLRYESHNPSVLTSNTRTYWHRAALSTSVFFLSLTPALCFFLCLSTKCTRCAVKSLQTWQSQHTGDPMFVGAADFCLSPRSCVCRSPNVSLCQSLSISVCLSLQVSVSLSLTHCLSVSMCVSLCFSIPLHLT